VRRRAAHAVSGLVALQAAVVICVLAGSAFAVVGAPKSDRSARLRAPSGLRVISYYPSAEAWANMWTYWDPVQVEADLGRIAGLHANTVRAIVQARLFGYPHVDLVYAAELREFVDLAAEDGLHVELTLFDSWYGYADPPTWTRAWVREILEPYVGDPRIAFVELRNEIAVNATTLRWARKAIPFARKMLRGKTPVTVSVGGDDALARLAALKRGLRESQPDFYDVHYFGGGGENALSFALHARAIAAPRRVWIGETGYPTTTAVSGYGGIPFTISAQESAQAHFLATVAWGSRAAGLAPPGIWTMFDFLPTAVPRGVVKQPEIELHYGLLHTDGTAKPAAAEVRASFSTGPPLAFNGDFEQAVDSPHGTVPAVWSTQGDAGVTFAWDPTVSHSGSGAARLAGSDATSTGSYSVTPPNCGMRAGTRITAGAWSRQDTAGPRAFVVVEWTNSSGYVVRRSSSRSVTTTEEWQHLSLSAVAPRGAAYARIDLVATHLSEKVWFDDVTWSRTASKTSR
jgi:hypothetical protein